MPLNPEELHVLLGKIDELNREMDIHRVSLVNAEKKARWARSVAIVGVVGGIIGGAVGLGAVAVGVSARATARDLEASRKEQQVSACVQANLNTQRTREALVAGVSVLTQPDPRRGAVEQAHLDRFIVEYTNHVNGALPYRDCSPAGIERYYQHPPADPTVGATTTTTVPLPVAPTTGG